MTRQHPRTVATTVLLAAAVALTGCGSGRDQLVDPAALQAGACSAAGPHLNALNKELGELEDGADTSGPIRQGFEATQAALITVRDGSDVAPEVKADLGSLIDTVGKIRFGLVSKNFDSTIPLVDAAAKAVVDRCRIG